MLEDDSSPTDWVIGDAALVFWCQKWHPASVVEIGGQSHDAVSLRLRPNGYDGTSDLWVQDKQWNFRLRPLFVAAAGGGRLERGHCGHPGEHVALSWFDCPEHPYWLGSGELLCPVGRVISSQQAARDGVEVEVTTLGVTETIYCSNSMMRLIRDEEFTAMLEHVKVKLHSLPVRPLPRPKPFPCLAFASI
jgi:hypothetical protein